MIFIFRKKKLVLDCFTKDVHVYEYAPIQPAVKHLPDWWKQLPKRVDMNNELFDNLNMKSCYGLIHLYETGVMLTMWSDLRIIVNLDGSYRYQYSDKTSTVDFHAPSQYEGWVTPNQYAHMKLVSPWFFSCKENINWLYVPPIYNQNDLTSHLLCVGTMEFKYQHGTNINYLLPVPKEKKLIQIDHGQPLAHVIPLADRRIQIQNHLIDEKEYEKMRNKHVSITFLRKHEKIMRLQKSKCPFRG